MTDSPLASRFVRAASLTTDRNGDKVEAIAIHMAEGGGTVEWISNPRSGNSSHYVIRYTGEVVQMVREADSAHSIRPGTGVRSTDDPPFTYLGETIRYGATAARRTLGADYRDPNTQVIAFEVEGYAATGPNKAQRAALKALVADIRRRRGPLPCLAHRDFQDYKRCPGQRIPWVDYGGHAVRVGIPTLPDTSTEEAMKLTDIKDLSGTATLPEAWRVWRVRDNEAVDVPDGRSYAVIGSCQYHHSATKPDGYPGYLIGSIAGDHELHVLPATKATFVAAKPAPGTYKVIVGGKAVGSVVLP